MPTRSHLWIPGDKESMLAKAGLRGADVLFIDLEDGVARSRKAAAREIAGEWLSASDSACPVWVRVNHEPDLIEEDIDMAVRSPAQGIIIPKVETRVDLDHVAEIVGAAEARNGLASGTVRLIPVIETASAVLDAARILAAGRVNRAAMGEADLAAELGITLSPDEREMLPIRLQIIVASAAAGVEAPIGPVETNFRDLDALRVSCLALKRMGFGGRQAIHPAQVEVINQVFSPTPAELAAARALLDAAAEAADHGDGAFLDDQGRMVDEAVLKTARRVVAAEEPTRPGTANL